MAIGHGHRASRASCTRYNDLFTTIGTPHVSTRVSRLARDFREFAAVPNVGPTSSAALGRSFLAETLDGVARKAPKLAKNRAKNAKRREDLSAFVANSDRQLLAPKWKAPRTRHSSNSSLEYRARDSLPGPARARSCDELPRRSAAHVRVPMRPQTRYSSNFRLSRAVNRGGESSKPPPNSSPAG